MTVASGLPAQAKIKAVPGREGDVWLAGGFEGEAYGLWRSTDSGASFVKLSNVEEADNVGFGKAAAGQTYPAVYAPAQVGGVRGLYRSDDAGATWVRINDDQHQWGVAGTDAITGDPRVYGRVYVSTNGRGIIYGDLGGGGGTPTPPAAPSGLTATAASASQINLNWADNATDETGFKVERATNSTFTAGLVTIGVGANVTSHQATGLAANTTYFFRVRATNAAGDSADSNTASATTKRR